jgi:polyisoprenoid-binding protein YceI
MHRLALLVCGWFAIMSTAAAQIQSWRVDPVHSSAGFAVRHLGISTVRGNFEKVNGSLSYDPADVGKSSIEATIDTATINTRIEARDKDLRSPHFFDVEKYPVITFKSKRIEGAGAGKLRVTGDLTIHGVTKDVVLNIEGPSSPIKDSSGTTRMGVEATANINRMDFGVSGAAAAVGDEVQITLDVELIEASSPPSSQPSR